MVLRIHHAGLFVKYKLNMLPVQVSYGASTPTVSNHEIYQTFARSIPPYNFMGEAIAQLLLYYNWDKVTIFQSLLWGGGGGGGLFS